MTLQDLLKEYYPTANAELVSYRRLSDIFIIEYKMTDVGYYDPKYGAASFADDTIMRLLGD